MAARAFRASISNLPSGSWAMMAFGMPLSRIRAVSARVSIAGQADDAPGLQPGIEVPGGAPVRRLGDGGAEDGAPHAGRGGSVDALGVLLVGAHIADMGEGEGDDLARIGRVGQDFLIARHGGVEADFAGRLADGADPEPFEHGSVLQHEEGGRARLRPAIRGGPGGVFILQHRHDLFKSQANGPRLSRPRWAAFELSL